MVLKWSRARARYERQGLLVEEAALSRAETECLSDAEARTRRRDREAERRAELDRDYVARFARRVRKQYPRAPAGVELAIAEHACRKYSGRVGRSAAAKALDPVAVRFAVAAHIRHRNTPYDELLSRGWDRRDARDEVGSRVRQILDDWEGPKDGESASR